MGQDDTVPFSLACVLLAAALTGLLRWLQRARSPEPPTPLKPPLPAWLLARPPSPLPPPFLDGPGRRVDLDELLRGVAAGLDGVEVRGVGERVLVHAPASAEAALRRALEAAPPASTVVQACEFSLGQEDGVVVRAARAGDSDPLTLHLRVRPTPRSGGRSLASWDAGLRELPWAERYARQLAECSLHDIRDDVFRFSVWAEWLAAYGRRHGARTALCPSVGLTVDPWLLAAAGLRVVAFDRAPSAVAAVGHPGRRPQVYSAAAKRAWELQDANTWTDGSSPHAFGSSPDLGHPAVLAELAPRVVALVADWRRLPLGDGAVDVLFATNALPREDGDEAVRAEVLSEWARVLRPGGTALVCMHNARHIGREAAAFFAARGLRETDLRDPAAPAPGPEGAFQVVRSSG